MHAPMSLSSSRRVLPQIVHKNDTESTVQYTSNAPRLTSNTRSVMSAPRPIPWLTRCSSMDSLCNLISSAPLSEAVWAWILRISPFSHNNPRFRFLPPSLLER